MRLHTIFVIKIISPLSHDYCERCNRVRLTADGRSSNVSGLDPSGKEVCGVGSTTPLDNRSFSQFGTIINLTGTANDVISS